MTFRAFGLGLSMAGLLLTGLGLWLSVSAVRVGFP